MSIDNKIPNGWVDTTLGEVCNLLDCLHRTPKYSKVGLPMVRVTDVVNGVLDTENCFNVDDNVFKAFSKGYEPKIGDIVFTRVGSFGFSAIVKKIEKFCIGQNTTLLIPQKIHPFFLFYYLISREARFQIDSLSSGSTQPTISMESIRKVTLPYPPLPEQTAIAKILTAFDDKIELLQAQNKTLETTAQTIFKEWFGKYQIGDELPDGWRVGKIEEIATLKSGYAFKSKDFVETSKVKALKIKDLKGNGNVSISDVSSVDEGCTKIERVQFFKLIKGDIVLAMSGNTTGKIGVVPPHKIELYLNQRVGKFFLKDKKNNSYLYNFLMSGNYEDKILSMGYGSAQPNISPSQIENIDIIYPKADVIQKYLNISNPVFEKVLKNNSQIQALKQTRDTLLPKLMSGALRVDEFKESAV